jgi:hypothetical protein
MLLRDVPKHPAYVVFHDAYDNGAMDVWPAESLLSATVTATARQESLEAMSQDECGIWRAYEKLPHKRVFKFHTR